MHIHLRQPQDHAVSTWAGGSTTELCIQPTTATCAGRNFAFRVSSATVELEESVFSDFTGFTRHIMPLEGSMALWHDGRPAATLQPCEGHTFDGGWQTKSVGVCVDCNLIHVPSLHGSLVAVRGPQAVQPVGHGHTGIFARCDGLVVSGVNRGEAFTRTLGKDAFLLLELEADEAPGEVWLTAPGAEAGSPVLAVVACVGPNC